MVRNWKEQNLTITIGLSIVRLIPDCQIIFIQLSWITGETNGLGRRRGVAKFDNYSWTTFNSSNSGLPDNHVYSIA